ncbi:MAG: flagellar assembly protein FliH [Spirochaetaceae bacterium]|jgi:flagellar assembly protein FliH|nr:flagellar assembly protein FliH [Spirochaetaceae bacterium]
MPRAVFRSNEVEYVNNRVVLEAPFPEQVEEAALEDAAAELAEPAYTGPTADELRREAEKFKQDFEKEKALMMEAARSQSEAIVEDGRKQAGALMADVKLKADELAAKTNADCAAQKQQAEDDVTKMLAAAETDAEAKRTQGHDEGFEKGKDEGFAQGKVEVNRLIERIHRVLERLQDKRADVLNETEQQIIDLVLLIARKVVKSVSETQKNVVIENIREALGKVKSKGKVTIKVNLSDLELATAHIEEFTKQLESSGTIEILEDSSIDAGGCVVETDFGAIDARIANQLAELEAKILELSPIKRTGR